MSGHKFTIIAIFVIIILGLGVYVNSLNNKFVWDDEDLVRNNTFIKKWDYLPEIFTQDVEAGVGKRSSLYHPLQIFTYRLDYSLWRLNVSGYHLTNILLHILVGLAVYWLIAILYKDALLSLITSILFIIHPIHSEAIAYISGRSDSLFMLFMLASFICYIKYINSGKPGAYFVMLITYILALLCKELSIIFPALLFLYHYTFRKRFNIKAFVPISCLAFIYIISRVTILKSFLPDSSVFSTTVFQRMPGFFVAIANYIRLLFLPSDLHMQYGNSVFSWVDPMAIAGILLTVSLLIYSFIKKKENNPLSFSIYWFFISLIPLSNLYPINAYMAEHWLYLPSIGFFLILANGAVYLYRNKNLKILTILLITVVSGFYSYLTIRQNTYWKEPMVLYKRILQYAPDSAGIYNNIGNIYRDRGSVEDAIASYEKALELDPKLVDAFNNLGNIYSEIGQSLRAITFFERAIEIDPTNAEVYNNLGITYVDIGNNNEGAMDLFKKAIEVNPYYAPAYNSLGNLYRADGRTERAIHAYKKAVSIDSDYALAYNNLGNAYRDLGKDQKAIDSYLKSLAINPDFSRAYNDLGIAYHKLGNNQMAITSFQDAIKIDPYNASAYNNLGNIYTVMGENDKAIDFLEKSIEFNSAYAEAYNNLGNVYVAMKDNQKAINSYTKAIIIDPEYGIAHINLAVVYYYERIYDLSIEHCDKAIELGSGVKPEFLALLEPYRDRVIDEK
ncbi:MAG: tetratricopeptide repeat protein [Candidatus Omnitrophica bacterium]|nr:tetratricopeptide repeat protein [Candidatus Omnitrophota bacterium]